MHRVVPYVFLILIAATALVLPRSAAAGDYYYNRYYDGAPVRYEGGYVNDGYRYGDSYRYDDGYRYRPRYRYGSSDCCYRRVVRYRKIYRDYERPYYNSGSYYSAGYSTRYYGDGYRYRSYDRPYYSRPYYGTRYTTTRYYDDYERPYYRSYRSYSSPYYGTGYRTTYYGTGYYGTRYGYGGNSWRYASQPRTFHTPACTTIRYKVYDDLGGWVWAKRRTC
jgi:hypothetical protein